MRRVFSVSLILFWGVPHANAWGNRGHEVVAYIAYMNLDPQIKTKVDTLIQQNPCIKEWKADVKTVPAAQQPVALFMLAATWPDKIKLTPPETPYDCPGHPIFDSKDGANGPDGRFSADIPPNTPEASQNTGYGDNRRHQYWHFIDTPISGDGTATRPAYEPNVLTELNLLSQALGSNKSDEVIALRSYDLVWVEHLAGDIHQPLHDTQRFTAALPNGDEGGNSVAICSGQQKCRAELHAYWDDLPGSDSSLTATIKMASKLNEQEAPDDATIDINHPEHWVSDAVNLARADAYAPPFNGSVKPVAPSAITAGYHSQAMMDMQKQVFIAGYRLAKLLNSALKSWSGT
jgi:hypothetical protein